MPIESKTTSTTAPRPPDGRTDGRTPYTLPAPDLTPRRNPPPRPTHPSHRVSSLLQEESRVVIIRFGSDADDTCMQMDETLASVADKMKNFAVVYLVDITEVPDFNAMYELYDPCTVMFFFRNRVRALLLFCLSRVYRLPVTQTNETANQAVLQS